MVSEGINFMSDISSAGNIRRLEYVGCFFMFSIPSSYEATEKQEMGNIVLLMEDKYSVLWTGYYLVHLLILDGVVLSLSCFKPQRIIP